jgi:hypothetical protein
LHEDFYGGMAVSVSDSRTEKIGPAGLAGATGGPVGPAFMAA